MAKQKFVRVRHIYLGSDKEIKYPTGENIQRNMPIILQMIDKIKKINRKRKILNLWCMGSSGAIIAGIISSQISNTVICHIKKNGEDSHTTTVPQYYYDDGINLIVDDFISTGSTINTIAKKMGEESIPIQGVCVSCSVNANDLSFNPDFIICGKKFTRKYYENNKGKNKSNN